MTTTPPPGATHPWCPPSRSTPTTPTRPSPRAAALRFRGTWCERCWRSRCRTTDSWWVQSARTVTGRCGRHSSTALQLSAALRHWAQPGLARLLVACRPLYVEGSDHPAAHGPQDPPFGIHLCGGERCVLGEPVVPVHDDRVRPYRWGAGAVERMGRRRLFAAVIRVWGGNQYPRSCALPRTVSFINLAPAPRHTGTAGASPFSTPPHWCSTTCDRRRWHPFTRRRCSTRGSSRAGKGPQPRRMGSRRRTGRRQGWAAAAAARVAAGGSAWVRKGTPQHSYTINSLPWGCCDGETRSVCPLCAREAPWRTRPGTAALRSAPETIGALLRLLGVSALRTAATKRWAQK
jgi:hypothetical protein